jgi:hypothetical protein
MEAMARIVREDRSSEPFDELVAQLTPSDEEEPPELEIPATCSSRTAATAC